MKPRNNIELSELQEQRKAIHKKKKQKVIEWRKKHSRNGVRTRKYRKALVPKFTDEEFRLAYSISTHID